MAMRKMQQFAGLILVGFACCGINFGIYANSLQASVYGGISRTHLDLGALHISDDETDTLHNDNKSEGTIGAGIAWQFNLSNREIIQGLLGNFIAGINYFHFDADPRGTVWLYGLPQFANYFYQLSLKTDRLLINGQAELFPSWQIIHPYVEAGVGLAHIRSQYWELPVVQSGVSDGNLIFSSRTNRQLVYSLGAGIKRQLAPHWTLSLAYNFTDFGTVHAGPYDNDLVIKQSLDIAIKLHTALLGISYQWA